MSLLIVLFTIALPFLPPLIDHPITLLMNLSAATLIDLLPAPRLITLIPWPWCINPLDRRHLRACLWILTPRHPLPLPQHIRQHSLPLLALHLPASASYPNRTIYPSMFSNLPIYYKVHQLLALPAKLLVLPVNQ